MLALAFQYLGKRKTPLRGYSFLQFEWGLFFSGTDFWQ
jgi:hypothetical protein